MNHFTNGKVRKVAQEIKETARRRIENAIEFEQPIRARKKQDPLVYFIPKGQGRLACVPGARKGKGEGKSGTRGEKEKEAPAASPLFISSRPFSKRLTSGCQMTANQNVVYFSRETGACE